MASRSVRRARANERKRAKAFRLASRAIASKRHDNLAIIASNRPPSPAELLERRAWQGVTDSTTHVAGAAAYSMRETSNVNRGALGMSDHDVARYRAKISRKCGNQS